MTPLNQGRWYITDPPQCRRVAAIVEQSDIGSVLPGYLGTQDYTFEEKDVGRLLETVENFSPGAFAWRFGSMFEDLYTRYPDPFPYASTE